MSHAVFVCDRSGLHGSNGANGRPGGSGASGNNGSRGGRGSDGQNGGRGEDGQHGQMGQNARIILCNISGQDHHSVSCSIPDGSKEVILLLAVGGNGGSGGNGGPGGNGGHGGDGGCGTDGSNGWDATEHSSAGNGGSGGPGGNVTGGDGGNGGNGGNGGYGAPGGSGASIQVRTTNPALLKFVHAKASGGKGASGGREGNGGSRGYGGVGGRGGNGGRGGCGYSNNQGVYKSPGFGGSGGRAGYNGDNGYDGASGRKGTNGKNGPDGKVEFVVYDDEGNVQFKGDSVFDLEVTSYDIQATGIPNTYNLGDDGVVEPGECIEIDQVVVKNSGGIPLPAGSLLEFPSWKKQDYLMYESLPESDTYSGSCILPMIMVGESYDCNFKFKGRVAQVPSPVFIEYDCSLGVYIGYPPNRLNAMLRISSYGSILTSPFEPSSLVHRDLKVQYPIRIEMVEAPTQLGLEVDRGTLNITIANISNRDYGSADCTFNSVKMIIYFDPRFDMHRSDVTENQKYGLSMFEEEIPFIECKGCVTKTYQFSAKSNAQFFERNRISIHLYLRNKLIEITDVFVRISPTFIPIDPEDSHPYDCLFVTDSHISRFEFLRYQRIFHSLQLKVSYWDLEKYNGLSMNNTGTDWTTGNPFQGKSIIFPLKNSQNDYRYLDPIHLFQILKKEERKVSTHGGVLFIGTIPHLVLQTQWFESTLTDDIPAEDLTSRFIIGKPKGQDLQQLCMDFMKKKEEENPSKLLKFDSCDLNPEKVKGLGKFVVGTAKFKTLPLNACDNVLILSSKGNSSEDYLIRDNVNANLLDPAYISIPFTSNYVKAIMSVISVLPPKRRILLLTDNVPLRDWQFTLPTTPKMNPLDISLYDLVAWSLYKDMKNEMSYNDCEPVICKQVHSQVNDLGKLWSQLNDYHLEMSLVCILFAFKKVKKQMKWNSSFSSIVKNNYKTFKITFNQLEQDMLNVLKSDKKRMKTVTDRTNYLLKHKMFNLNITDIERPLYTERHKTHQNKIYN